MSLHLRRRPDAWRRNGELTSAQILASGAASFTYEAPAEVAQETPVVITAVAGEDPDATATVTITVEPAPG